MTIGRSSNRAASASLAIASVALTLLAVEGVLRITSRDPLGPPSPRHAADAIELLASPYPATFDPRLGYVPTPGASGRANVWGTRVTIGADGMRSNGGGPVEGVPIVAVGDSFTFGDEVHDDETWPAALERRVGRPVLNAGVFGYGLDQIVLRAEQILDSTRADLMIVALIGDSVSRCEYSYRYAWKPYFEIEGGRLRLRNVPVPEPGTPARAAGPWRGWMGRSHLLYWLGARLDPDRWLTPDSIRVHEHGPAVARLLVERLSRRAAERGVRLVWVLLWHPGADSRPARPALERAQELGQPVIALGPRLRKLMPVLPDGRARDPSHLFHWLKPGQVGHLSAAGNAEVARMLVAILEENGLIESPAHGPGGLGVP